MNPTKFWNTVVEITPFSTELPMVQLIDIVMPNERLKMSPGHPISSIGNAFATAPHTVAARNRPVYLAGTNTRIGVVVNAFYEQHRDVAIVNLAPGFRVSTAADGIPIGNFRATPRRGDPIISIRGRSGTNMTSTIYSTTFISQVSPINSFRTIVRASDI